MPRFSQVACIVAAPSLQTHAASGSLSAGHLDQGLPPARYASSAMLVVVQIKNDHQGKLLELDRLLRLCCCLNTTE